MRTNLFAAPVLLAGTAAIILAGCGDVSDFPTTAPATARPVVAIPTLDIPTPEPTPTVDPQLASLWDAVRHDVSVLNGDLDALLQCDVYITDIAACRSALRTMQGQLGPMVTQLQGIHVGDDLQKAYGDMVDALAALQAGCADDLRYLDSRNHDDNVEATHEINHGFGLLDQAQWDMPPDPTPVQGGA